MARRGRPLAGALFGLLSGLLAGVNLVLLGAVRLDSIVLAVLPLAGLLAGVALGWFAPLARLRRTPVTGGTPETAAAVDAADDTAVGGSDAIDAGASS